MQNRFFPPQPLNRVFRQNRKNRVFRQNRKIEFFRQKQNRVFPSKPELLHCCTYEFMGEF